MPRPKHSRTSRPVELLERLETRVLWHAGPAGGGLLGQYFNNANFTDLKLSRTDVTVSFSWGAASPAPAIAGDTFSVRWTGKIVPHVSESYTFHTSSDDGVRLWIDGKLVIDKLASGPLTSHASKPIALTAGRAVDVRLDYFDNTGAAVAKLMWSSASTAKAVIPKDHLLPPGPPPPPLPPSPPPPPSTPPSGRAIRIDAAGDKSYTTADGKVWQKDTFFVGGALSTGGFAIGGTSDDSFYATRRFGKSFGYAIPVSGGGTHQVTLHFADGSFNAGGRVFDVSAEGKTVLNHFDIVAKAGKGVATTATFNVTVTDGKLNLAFAGVNNNATVSAIEVVPLAASPTKLTWKSVAASPVKRAEANGATVNGKLYALGGYVSQPGGVIHAQLRCDVYDPATNKWTRLRDMPEAFTHAAIAVDGEDIWLVGGYLGNHPGPGTTRVWRYDTGNDTWHRGPDLPQKRGAGAAAVANGRLHYFGGMDETRTIECGDHWSLDLNAPGADWVRRADMPNPRNHLGGASAGGKIYAIGGQYGQEEQQVAQSQVDCYDFATDAWTTVPPLPDERSHLVGCTFAMDGKIIVIGGETGFLTQRNNVWSYDPAGKKWTSLGTLPQNRSSVVSGALDGRRFILTTGNNPDATANTWIGTLG